MRVKDLAKNRKVTCSGYSSAGKVYNMNGKTAKIVKWKKISGRGNYTVLLKIDGVKELAELGLHSLELSPTKTD